MSSINQPAGAKIRTLSTPARHVVARRLLHAGFILIALVAGMQMAHAQSADLATSKSVYLQGNWAEHGTDAVSAGVTLPWGNWKKDLWGGELRGHWDLYVQRLSFEGVDYNHTWLLGIVPTLRLRPDAGRSPFFYEAGVGATYMTDRYETVHKRFSTSFNFATHIGVGYNFGDQRRHEVLLRVEHISNASIKKPNPGENFVQVRYAYHF